MVRPRATFLRAFLLQAILWGGLAPTAAFAQLDPRATQEFPPTTVLTGSAHELGFAYGQKYREEIQDFLKRELYDAFDGKPSSKEQILEYAAACGKVVREECPLVAAESAGVAEGAAVSFDEIVLVALHEELYHRTELPKHGHCTAVAVGPPDTANDHTYVGQTWDWMQSVAGKSRITQWNRTEAPRVLAYGFPGMPMGAGMNEEGIALCWTSANLQTKGQTARVGIPSYMLISHLLAQKDMESVIREAKKNKHAGWFTFVMADRHGRLVNIEGSPERVVIEEAEGRLARVLYGSREMTGVKPDAPPPLNARCQKMYDLLAKAEGKNDLARLQDYFAEPSHGINVGKGTIDMMVFDTTSRTASLSRGPSFKLSWRKFQFEPKP